MQVCLENILVFIVILSFYFLNKRFEKIENYIKISGNPENNSEELKKLSYQIETSIQIEWGKIIRWCFPEMKNDDEAWSFVKKLYEDKGLKLDEDASLFRKYFSFVEFYDGVSGMNMVWSNQYMRFLKEMEVLGFLFKEGDSHEEYLFDKFPDNHITRLMVVSPSFIGFHSNLPDGFMGDEDKISQFPYYAIVSFFANIQKNSGTIWGGMAMVKKFPKNIQDVFDKFQIKYTPWDHEDYGTSTEANKELIKSKWLEDNDIELYNQEMRSHSFTSPYYTISTSISFFNPDDR